MGADGGGCSLGEVGEQCMLLGRPQFATTAQGRAAGEANEQAILPIVTIFCGQLCQFGQVMGELLLTHTSRYGAHKETAASKALALQAKAAQHGQALLK